MTERHTTLKGPHQGQPVLAAGQPLSEARAAVVLLHGRGAAAQSILALARDIGHPAAAYLAPQAGSNTWYPNRFIAPLASNEPWLSSALAAVGAVVGAIEAAGIPPDRIVLGGFSQGACLAAEYVARHPRRYGGLFVLSGGLIGEPGTTWDVPAVLGQMPVFIGCSDRDAHVPLARVQESSAAFEAADAAVTERIYPGMAHLINADEVDHVKRMVASVAGGA